MVCSANALDGTLTLTAVLPGLADLAGTDGGPALNLFERMPYSANRNGIFHKSILTLMTYDAQKQPVAIYKMLLLGVQ
jgi:hypothetical protein